MPLDQSPCRDAASADAAITSTPHSAFRTPRFLGPALQWALFLLVLAFVGWHGHRLWGDIDSHTLQVRWEWLALATLVSMFGWLPSCWYWRRLLTIMGATPGWPQVIRAYYLGHPGKYVPGKAMVIVIRAALLRPSGVPAATTALTVTLETLTFVSAGVVTMVLLIPWIAAGLPQFGALAEQALRPAWRIAFPVLALVGSVGGLAALSWMSVRLASRVQRTIPGVGSLVRPVPWATFAVGLFLFLGAWWLQGMMLGLTLQALSPEPVDWGDWPMWTGMSAVSLVGGFLAVFTPGGLGVREGLLMELLRQQTGPHEAVAAALLLRGVSLAGELLSSVVLFLVVNPVSGTHDAPR